MHPRAATSSIVSDPTSAKEGSSVATCPVAPDLASLIGRALVLPHVEWLQTFLPAREGSGIATRSVAPNPGSLIGRAPASPRLPWLQTPPPYRGGLRCATCPMAPVPPSHPLWLPVGREPQA
jgi:hypothetical protein